MTNPFPGHERYQGMLAIPYLRHDNQPVSIRFRCLEDHNHRAVHFGGKYNSVKGDPARTYNVKAIHSAADTLHVAEGEMDSIILCKVGLPAIAIPGANSWTGRHRRMLAGFRRVYVWADGDEAGAEMLNKITRSLVRARGVRVPRGEDVNSVFLSGGAEALYQLVAEEDRP